MLIATQFLPYMDLNPVSASEEEEVDYFANMPNFRWDNETTTTDTEEMIDSGYSVDTTNLNATGNAKFEKSRLLNSRDFFVESRFALDNGGNQTEYFRDEVGNSVDFSEDYEGWNLNSRENGIGIKEFSARYQNLQKELGERVNIEIYDSFEIRMKASVNVPDIRFITRNNDGYAWITYAIMSVTTEWQVFTGNLIDLDIQNWFNDLAISPYSDITYPITVYIDYIRLLGDLDYATHAEGEIEDTWDWDDSNEYFYDEMNNVSDFNDGTGENWTASTIIGGEGYNFANDANSLDGWYTVQDVYASDNVKAECVIHSGDTVDSMEAFDFQFSIPSGVNIDGIVVRFEMDGTLGRPADVKAFLTKDGIGWVDGGLPAHRVDYTGDQWEVYGDSSEDWGETWTYSEINDNVNFKVKLEATYVSGSANTLECDSISIEVFTSLAETEFSTSNGWGNITASVSTDQLMIERTGLSIDSSVYSWLTMECYVKSGTVDYIQIRDDVYGLGLDHTNREVGEYFLFSLDLNNDADWSGTETTLVIDVKFTSASSNNAIDLNMVYLYDIELGDLEGSYGASVVNHMYVNPEGYMSIVPAVGGTLVANLFGSAQLPIDTSLFQKLTIRWRGIGGGDEPNVLLKLKAYNPIESEWNLLTEAIYSTWTTTVIDLSSDQKWLDSSGSIRFVFYAYDSPANWEGDERLDIDYMLLTGEYEESKFKFSILDHNSEEMGYFGFGRHNETFYNLSVDLYDSIGSFLTYEESFAYNSPEWLRMDLELDLDKKEMKFILEYDNGSDIFKLSLHTMFGYLGRQQPIIFQGSWFPRFCLNNSMLPMSRSAFVIDFINANYDIIDIKQLQDADWSGLALQNTNEPNFETGKYGVFIDGYESVDDVDIYTMNIDKFDGFNFEIFLNSENLDDQDFVVFGMAIYNIQTNGTPFYLSYNMAGIEKQSATTEYSASILGWAGYALKTVDTTDDLSMSVKFSWYHENYESLTNQIVFSVDGEQHLASTIEFDSTDLSVELTKEYQFLWWWFSDNTVSGFGDDIITASMGGMDITRKDFLGDIAGGIVKGFTDIIGFILAPFILIFQFLAFVLKGLGDMVIGVLEPILNGIGDLISGIVTVLAGIATDLGNLAGTLTDAISGIASSVWSGIGSALDFITDAIVIIGSDIITALISSLSEIVEDLLGFLVEFVTVLNELTDLMFEFIINSIIMPIITDFFAGLGLSWLLDDLLILIENLGDVIINLVAGAMALLGWLVVTIVWVLDNGDLIGLVLGLFIVFFLFRPMFYFVETPFEDWFTSEGIDQVEETSRRMKEMFLILFNLIIKFFELVFKLLTTIGSYIPFT